MRKYIYECMSYCGGGRSSRLETLDKFEEIEPAHYIDTGKYIYVYDGTSNTFNAPVHCIVNEQTYMEWKTKLAITDTNTAGSSKKSDNSDAINPSHYQAYMVLEHEVLQWLEAMQYLPRFRDPEVFKAAVELQARKYLDRLGGKDESAQEIMKSVWYLKFIAAYIKNGNKPIRVKDVARLTGE